MVPLPLLCKHSYSRTPFPNVNILVVITIPCNEMKWSSRLLIELLLHLLLYCFWIRRQYINLMNSNIYINYWLPCYSMSGRNNNLGTGKKHNNYCKRLETFYISLILCLLLLTIFGEFVCGPHLLVISTCKYIKSLFLEVHIFCN